ncbi:MAG: hypothetical protein ABIU30_18530 [Ferruginibacter sp.]
MNSEKIKQLSEELLNELNAGLTLAGDEITKARLKLAIQNAEGSKQWSNKAARSK